ncbi:MAG TPA: HAD family phosphatase [Terracidiphilus sp.]|nr:HAD family phosphatase [Terracidiphilus sp.]
MALRAVIFDFGMVLTGLPDAKAHDELLRITGLDAERFEHFYWADRHAYDEGKLTGLGFWQKLVRDAGLSLPDSTIEELNRWDARMWTTVDPAMLAWHAKVKETGVLTAILSNMGDSVLENIEREFDWLSSFDALVWSYQLGVAKPDPAIYQYTLKQLGTAAGDTLFIDDKPVNVEAARALGMQALVYTTLAKLRYDLLDQGLSPGLPLPE